MAGGIQILSPLNRSLFVICTHGLSFVYWYDERHLRGPFTLTFLVHLPSFLVFLLDKIVVPYCSRPVVDWSNKEVPAKLPHADSTDDEGERGKAACHKSRQRSGEYVGRGKGVDDDGSANERRETTGSSPFYAGQRSPR
jgi:hypothetical protein